MIVIHKNELCTLDMSYDLFECLQRDCPSCDVTIYPLTSSYYKKLHIVAIGDIEDYSIARNLIALGIVNRQKLRRYETN